MAQQYAYHYAIIEADGLCLEVRDTTVESSLENYIAIPEYNEDYIFKYYNRADGKWYTDSAFTTEWTPT